MNFRPMWSLKPIGLTLSEWHNCQVRLTKTKKAWTNVTHKHYENFPNRKPNKKFKINRSFPQSNCTLYVTSYIFTPTLKAVGTSDFIFDGVLRHLSCFQPALQGRKVHGKNVLSSPAFRSVFPGGGDFFSNSFPQWWGGEGAFIRHQGCFENFFMNFQLLEKLSIK